MTLISSVGFNSPAPKSTEIFRLVRDDLMPLGPAAIRLYIPFDINGFIPQPTGFENIHSIRCHGFPLPEDWPSDNEMPKLSLSLGYPKELSQAEITLFFLRVAEGFSHSPMIADLDVTLNKPTAVVQKPNQNLMPELNPPQITP